MMDVCEDKNTGRLTKLKNGFTIHKVSLVVQVAVLIMVAAGAWNTVIGNSPFWEGFFFVLAGTAISVGYQVAFVAQLNHLKTPVLLFALMALVLLALDQPHIVVNAIFFYMISVIAFGRMWDEDARGIARIPLLLSIAFNVVTCSILFIALLFCVHLGKATLPFFAIIAVFVASALIDAWAYAKFLASSNKWFFRHICLVDEEEADPLVFAAKLRSADSLPKAFFLSLLLTPAESITRINEFIRPGIGLFNIETEYEILLPELIQKRCSELVLPVIIQEKDALLGDLRIEPMKGYSVRKLNDVEVRDYLEKSLAAMLFACGSAVGIDTAAQKLAKFIVGHPIRDNAEFEKLSDDVMGALSECNDAHRDIVRRVLNSFRFVKPVCASLERENATPDGWLFGSHVSIRAIRDVPLVPLRKSRRSHDWTKDTAIRLLTKRRMRYYFGLGNADRGQSYHLTFSGHNGTYLVDVQLMFIGGSTAFASAEKMTINNRFDQSVSRLFVRNGRGFSKVALTLSYETRSHRPIQVVCGSTTVCLLLLLQLGFNHVFGAEIEPITSSGLALPLTVLTIASLLSAWEAMEEYRAEEWLWLISGGMSVVSVISLVHLITLSQFEFEMVSTVHVVAWTGYITLIFVLTLLSFLALFEKVKQHGALMDKVPITRSAADDVKYSANFAELIEKQNSVWEATRNGQPNNRVEDTSVRFKSARHKRYFTDIKVYEGLFDETWPNGLLVPVWSGLQNPYDVPSVKYFDHILKTRQQQSVSINPEVQ